MGILLGKRDLQRLVSDRIGRMRAQELVNEDGQVISRGEVACSRSHGIAVDIQKGKGDGSRPVFSIGQGDAGRGTRVVDQDASGSCGRRGGNARLRHDDSVPFELKDGSTGRCGGTGLGSDDGIAGDDVSGALERGAVGSVRGDLVGNRRRGVSIQEQRQGIAVGTKQSDLATEGLSGAVDEDELCETTAARGDLREDDRAGGCRE